MPNHRRYELFRSFLGSHIDPQKNEVERAKTEIEGKIQMILQALGDDNNDGKEQLVNLIKDFHKHYQLLYERYMHLSEELRMKADEENGEGSWSSSNSNEMEKLHREYQTALSKTKEALNIIREYNSEAEKWNVKIQAENKIQILETELGQLRVKLEEKERALSNKMDLGSLVGQKTKLATQLQKEIETQKHAQANIISEIKRNRESKETLLKHFKGPERDLNSRRNQRLELEEQQLKGKRQEFLDQNFGFDLKAPSGPIDKSRVLDVRPLKHIVPVFPNPPGMSSVTNPNPSPFVCVPPSGPFPHGVQPFYPFRVTPDSQLTPSSAPNQPGNFGFGSSIPSHVPLNSFMTPPPTAPVPLNSLRTPPPHENEGSTTGRRTEEKKKRRLDFSGIGGTAEK